MRRGMAARSIKTLYYVSAAVSAGGLGLSIYLTLPSPLPEFCEIGSTFSCSAVILSSYSSIMGVPIAAVGAFWFGVALLLSLLTGIGSLPPHLLLMWGVIGVLGAVALLLVEVLLIGSICLLCTAAHAAGAVVLGLSVLGYLWTQPPKTSG
jgi:Predicted membrane protein